MSNDTNAALAHLRERALQATPAQATGQPGPGAGSPALEALGEVAGQVLKSAVRQAANQLGRQLVRGLLGSLLGKR